MVLLENSLHHINHMPLTELPKFGRLFKDYRKSIINNDDCCIDNLVVGQLSKQCMLRPGLHLVLDVGLGQNLARVE